MDDTRDSPEYQILEYLNENKNRLNNNISIENIFNGIKLVDRHRFDKDFPTLIPHYIDQRKETKGYKITEDGQARYGDMVRHEDSMATKSSVDRLTVIGSIVGVIGLLFTLIQTCNSCNQVSISRQSLELTRLRDSLQQTLSKPEQASPSSTNIKVDSSKTSKGVACEKDSSNHK
ncbi:MAG: hypothetical protein M3R17_06585 [Bacteroidota bacterium]|nr:hypothetical protein [Bacteroidota bacterium]